MAERHINETELLKVLSKIAFRLPTDKWDLSPAEYDLLEVATGEEIISLAYKHGLPIIRMLHKADELVDEHNSSQERQMLQDIARYKNMKLDLLSDLPRAKKTKVQNSEDVERKLVQESVDEVAGLGPIIIEEDSQEIEELSLPMNIVEELQRRGVLGKDGFDGPHENISKEISLPSLHRDFQGPPSINLQEVIPTDPDLHNLAAGQDFGDATDEELVQLSMYTGPHSKRLFDRIHSKDVSIEDINRQRKASAAVQDMMIPGGSPNIPAHRLSNVLADEIPRKQNDKLVPRLTTGRVAKTPTVAPSKDVSHSTGLQTPGNAGFVNQTPIDINAHINENVPLTPIDMIDMPGSAQQDFTIPAVRPEFGAFDGTMMTPVPQRSESRREMFERLANNIDDKLKQNRTPRKKPRRVARPQQPRSEFLELNKPLIFHKRKPKAGQVRMPEPALNMIMDMYEGLDDYDRNDVPDYQDDEPILPEQNQPVLGSINVTQHRQGKQAEVMPSFNDKPQQQILPPFDDEIADALQDQVNHPDIPSIVLQPPPIQSPDASFINIRPRLTLNVDAQMSKLSIPGPSRYITAATPALKDITNMSHIEAPLESLFQSINMPTVVQKPRSGIHRITEAEIEYAKLKFLSEHNMRKVNVTEQAKELEPPTNAQNLTAGTSKAALAPPPFVPVTEGAVGGKERDPGTHEDGRVLFRRFEKNGEWMIEFVGVNGTKEEYSEYCLETIGLYWQIRIIMKQRGTWKMKFAELQPMLSLLKPATPRVIENRVWFISDEGFIKLTFTDDDHIDEVEIKVNQAMLLK